MIVCMCDSERACMIECMIVCMCDKFNFQKNLSPIIALAGLRSAYPRAVTALHDRHAHRTSRGRLRRSPYGADLLHAAGFATLVHSHWEPPSFNNAHRLRVWLTHGS